MRNRLYDGLGRYIPKPTQKLSDKYQGRIKDLVRDLVNEPYAQRDIESWLMDQIGFEFVFGRADVQFAEYQRKKGGR